MNDKELQELQDPANWDYEKAESRPGNKNRRAIVSIAFARQDFERLAECAERMGLTLSAFIRDASLEKAANPQAALPATMNASSAFATYVNQDRPAIGGFTVAVSSNSDFVPQIKQPTKALADVTRSF